MRNISSARKLVKPSTKKKSSPKKIGAEDSIDYSLVLADLKRKYDAEKAPVEISFQKLVNYKSGVDRYTHLLHPYPAKLLLSIPYFFLRCSSIIEKPGVVLDPFCGSGTVLLESIVAGHDAVGADANPLARMLAKTKSTYLTKTKLEKAFQEIENLCCEENLSDSNYAPQNILDWNYWYSQSIQNTLKKIGANIEVIKDPSVRRFFEISFSSCVRKVSYADQSVSVPVKLNPARYEANSERNKKALQRLNSLETADVAKIFSQIVKANIKRLVTLKSVSNRGKLKKIHEDARMLESVKSRSVDLIITSPPYAGAQKYVRSSSLSLGWLNLCGAGGLPIFTGRYVSTKPIPSIQS